MTDSDIRVETWKAVPGYFAEASDRGRFRSVDRVLPSGRRCEGRLLATRVSNRGYVLVNVYDHAGVRQTRSGHSLVLLAFEGPCPPRKQARHWNDDGLDNRWAPGGEEGCRSGAGNLLYGTRRENDADRLRNNPEGWQPFGRTVRQGPPPPCSCCGEEPAHARGWCPRCYQRWVRAGRPDSGPPPAPQPVTCERCSRRWSHRVAVKLSAIFTHRGQSR